MIVDLKSTPHKTPRLIVEGGLVINYKEQFNINAKLNIKIDKLFDVNIYIKSNIKPVFRLFPVLLSALMIAACAVGPDYSPPETTAPDGWRADLEGGLSNRQTDVDALAQWWQTLNDPLLSYLVERAISENLGVKEARAKIREARARRAIAMAGLFPTLDATGSAKTNRTSEQVGVGRRTDLYQAGFDAGWEIDIFGGVRRSVEAATADMQAMQEEYYDVMVSLTAEVALNYLDVRSFQARLTVASSNLKVQEETSNITKWRYEAGLTTGLDVEQASYNLEATRSEIPSLKTGLEQAKNRLAVLLGRQPGDIDPDLDKPGDIPVAGPEIAVGVPADALRRRPDVRMLERELAAQTARIGVAKADLFPKLTLTGSIGLESLSSQDFLDAQSRYYNAGPGISWPIFRARAILQNVEVQNALQEQKMIQYKASILNALEEVENAMIAYSKEQEKRSSLLRAVQSARAAAGLSQDQYSSGLVDFQIVLEAQRSMLSFEDQLTQSSRNVTADLIVIYKALGGGWTKITSLEFPDTLEKK
ncbi:Type I secretion outer membrane protein [uncultured Desulfobacterium sp.]|uniref:Type I secretion outer membrane protein n=1 Tax=uncultured Desulfobacterium sp. TaxID=201089 RepID=A0A445MUX2_9BACT|nr:Type I secretion outer membrane protein [uncultured Desulfobacterium sp.]